MSWEQFRETYGECRTKGHDWNPPKPQGDAFTGTYEDEGYKGVCNRCGVGLEVTATNRAYTYPDELGRDGVQAVDPDPGWPEGSSPFDEPYTANKMIHARDRNRLLAMARSLKKMDRFSPEYDLDRALDIENGINFDAIVSELQRIASDV